MSKRLRPCTHTPSHDQWEECVAASRRSALDWARAGSANEPEDGILAAVPIEVLLEERRREEAEADAAIDEESPIRTVSRRKRTCYGTRDMGEVCASCTKERGHMDAHYDQNSEAHWTDANHYDGEGRDGSHRAGCPVVSDEYDGVCVCGSPSNDGSQKPVPLGNDELRACYGCHLCLDAPEHGILNPTVSRMILCPACGNKRCPRATDHRFACTGSNEPGQFGSNYGEPVDSPVEWRRGVGVEEQDVRGDRLWRALDNLACKAAPVALGMKGVVPESLYEVTKAARKVLDETRRDTPDPDEASPKIGPKHTPANTPHGIDPRAYKWVGRMYSQEWSLFDCEVELTKLIAEVEQGDVSDLVVVSAAHVDKAEIWLRDHASDAVNGFAEILAQLDHCHERLHRERAGFNRMERARDTLKDQKDQAQILLEQMVKILAAKI